MKRNYQCTLVGIKNSNDWEISKEKSKLEIGNVHIRKASLVKRNVHIGSQNEKIQIGNEKYPSWKLVMRKLKIGN